MSDKSDSYSKNNSFYSNYNSFCEQSNGDSNTFIYNQREDCNLTQDNIINPGNFSDNQGTNIDGPNINNINNHSENNNNRSTNPKTENNNTEITKKNQRGRKGNKNPKRKKHDKYGIDNIKNKCINLVLKYVRLLLNYEIDEYKIKNKIKKKYDGKILIIQPKSISSNYCYKQLFQKTISEIFSQNISTRNKQCRSDHNKELINYLLNHEDEKTRKFFNDLLNGKFIYCIEQFINYANYSYLINLTRFDEIKSNFGDKKYVKALKNGFNSLLELNKKEEKMNSF